MTLSCIRLSRVPCCRCCLLVASSPAPAAPGQGRVQGQGRGRRPAGRGALREGPQVDDPAATGPAPRAPSSAWSPSTPTARTPSRRWSRPPTRSTSPASTTTRSAASTASSAPTRPTATPRTCTTCAACPTPAARPCSCSRSGAWTPAAATWPRRSRPSTTSRSSPSATRTAATPTTRASAWRDLRNLFARHELDIALYYLRRTAYVAAADRAKRLLETYPQSQYQNDAVATLAVAYTGLGNETLADDAKRVLQQNDPNHPYLSGNWPDYPSNLRKLNPFAGEKSALDND